MAVGSSRSAHVFIGHRAGRRGGMPSYRYAFIEAQLPQLSSALQYSKVFAGTDRWALVRAYLQLRRSPDLEVVSVRSAPLRSRHLFIFPSKISTSHVLTARGIASGTCTWTPQHVGPLALSTRILPIDKHEGEHISHSTMQYMVSRGKSSNKPC